MGEIQLRNYQEEAIESLYEYFKTENGNPLVVLPTGSGKSLVNAAFIRGAFQQWPQSRVVVATHVKELIEQDLAAMHKVWPAAPTGVYSAGLGRKEQAPILFAGIQSIYKKALEFDPFDLVLIDEAHLVPPDGEGMYRQFLDDARLNNPHLKCIGFTATPYRMTTGLLTEGQGRIFTDVVYEASIQQLVCDGFLAPLTSRGSQIQADLNNVRVQNGEYVVADLELAMARGDVTTRALTELVQRGEGRRSWLVFCVSVAHAEASCEILRSLGIRTECVHGETPSGERDRILTELKSGAIRCVTNCMVLTTGFDAPGIDLIGFLRPTKSPGLFVQMGGRGMRLAPGKTDCLCLDYARLVETHGKIDSIRVRKRPAREGGAFEMFGVPCRTCPACGNICSISLRQCPECGTPFPDAEGAKHEATASEAEIMSEPPRVYDVLDVVYTKHEKRGKTPSMRVDYYSRGAANLNCPTCSEWVCFEHSGVARAKAASWWKRRAPESSRAPSTVDGALALTAGLRRPAQIAVSFDGEFERLVGVRW